MFPVDRDRTTFTERFGGRPEVLAIAPGRVNLIGGHQDYHEGLVLPLAIDRHIAIYARPREDSSVRVYSETTDTAVEFELHDLSRHPATLAQYCQGAARALAAAHPLEHGCDALISGNLPAGAGLSSSSALVVAFIGILARLNHLSLEPLELAQCACDAEHWFGTTGGIMDQYVITHGRASHALLIDCRALTHQALPMPESCLVVAHTGSSHHQAATPFARRRQEAEAGLAVLQTLVPGIRTLRDVSPELLEEHRAKLVAADPSEILWRRCRHVVTELQRVRVAATALAGSDLAGFGRLMKEAHCSLRDDYEVSSAPVEAMFEAAITDPACYGARMTGGGFGGCTVNLVAADQSEPFRIRLAEAYRRATGEESIIFPVQASDGFSLRELN